MKRQPVPLSLLDRVTKRFAYYGICSSPISFEVAYFLGGFLQKNFLSHLTNTSQRFQITDRQQELPKTHPDILGKFALISL